VQKAKGDFDHCQLDRLARNVAFISTFMESGISFLAADNPHANKLMMCLPKTLSGMTRGWAYGKEAADGRVSDPAAACYTVAVHAASAA
jgi:hypothetical protein